MKAQKTSLLIVTLAVPFLIPTGAAAEKPLEESFANPSREYSAKHFLRWTNGLVTKEGLAAEIAAFDAMNLRGFDADDIQEAHAPYERGPVRPMSPVWVTSGGRSPNGRVLFSSFLPGNIKKDAKLMPSGLVGRVLLTPKQ